MSKNIGAFFDIDGTLYREGLIAEIFKKLVKYEIIDPERWYNDVRLEYQKWDKRQGNYDNYLLRMADIYVEAIKGLHRSQVEFIARNVVNQKGDRVYTFTRDRIKWHKQQGHVLITISGSPIELVREMAQKHGFDDYKGAVYMLDKNELYTGEVVPMWDSKSKKVAIHHFADKYNIDLSKSYAYGDTAGDFTMFQLVGAPVLVNPTRELIKKVQESKETREKSLIVVERKDMVYKLTPDLIQID
ncbi:HAD-IB family hydrolase [Clostridium swellfunianum]|uniref:HAD-IB family hydrolase n=1 Tax=Clostridium swellfunianum TaxID=1367462 RepID=UPI00203090BA|nr:HAD-IB family hydrolase [Clostridium swellfunianum]MCM0650655.1 HAD-IB family hydrolase [Clostridium swellfunianum]